MQKVLSYPWKKEKCPMFWQLNFASKLLWKGTKTVYVKSVYLLTFHLFQLMPVVIHSMKGLSLPCHQLNVKSRFQINDTMYSVTNMEELKREMKRVDLLCHQHQENQCMNHVILTVCLRSKLGLNIWYDFLISSKLRKNIFFEQEKNCFLSCKQLKGKKKITTIHTVCISFWIPRWLAISTDTSFEIKMMVKTKNICHWNHFQILWAWDLKIILMAYIFTIIFISKLVSVEMVSLLGIQNQIQAVWIIYYVIFNTNFNSWRPIEMTWCTHKYTKIMSFKKMNLW